jgi:hypothetical protein
VAVAFRERRRLGRLIHIPEDAQILKNKWPSILESGGLCSAVVNGKAVT